ncbi:hypothetical protein [Nostoc sp. FACHB-190]|uniref:hypothetical protein n=1 Tax=Nostoc sp. FACHB-190 TaxID=2692838 RepID=UPI0016856FBB|nr:hypothetical protein [Nostoc sp. FACHB-190]MBD2303198.1 hypothetical protein [Nostoc sp. FACHB-190]
MYFKQNRPSNKSASDSSTTNQFAPRPFKVEDSPAQDIVQAENLDTQPQKRPPVPKYRDIPVFAPNQVQTEPFSPRLQLKIDPNYQQDVYSNTLEQPSEQRILLQPKLTIGEPGDKYEVEADHIAKNVVERIHSTDNQVEQVPLADTSLEKANPMLARMSILRPDEIPAPQTPRLQMKLSIREPGEEQEAAKQVVKKQLNSKVWEYKNKPKSAELGGRNRDEVEGKMDDGKKKGEIPPVYNASVWKKTYSIQRQLITKEKALKRIKNRYDDSWGKEGMRYKIELPFDDDGGKHKAVCHSFTVNGDLRDEYKYGTDVIKYYLETVEGENDIAVFTDETDQIKHSGRNKRDHLQHYLMGVGVVKSFIGREETGPAYKRRYNLKDTEVEKVKRLGGYRH